MFFFGLNVLFLLLSVVWRVGMMFGRYKTMIVDRRRIDDPLVVDEESTAQHSPYSPKMFMTAADYYYGIYLYV